MAVDIIITLTSVGTDQGSLFNLYSDTDGFNVPYETDVAIGDLQSGYTTNAPDNTTIVRVCGKQAECLKCVDIIPNYTTTTSTTLPPIGCEEIINSGGAGVTEYLIPLDVEGGNLILDFEAYGVPDKLEILHFGTKVATSGMTVANSGPFDNVYGDPTVPSTNDTYSIDQFIGTQKAIPPTREAEILADLGEPYTPNGQQLIWWSYNTTDVEIDAYATVRITGPSGTAWELSRMCEPNVTTTTTTTQAPTTTTTTTQAPTTTTTTTLAGLESANISNTTELKDGCSLSTVTVNVSVWIDTQSGNNTPTVGDIIYTNSNGTSVFVGDGNYYKFTFDSSTYYGARVNAFGEILSPISICA